MTFPNHQRSLLWAIAIALACGWTISPARADIYEWTTGTDGSIVQSTTACPGGSGVNATPNAFLSSLDLTQAYLLDANLAGANLLFSTLTNANLSNANLTGASLDFTTLANANFTGAAVFGATFSRTSLTSAQLYSTASYQAKNLQGIGLTGNDLAGWNFAGQNLTGAALGYTTLVQRQLHGRTVPGANFTLHFAHILATLSTASYQAKDIHGISLSNNDMTGWNFAGQNLTGAILDSGTLSDANLTNANLTAAQFLLCDAHQRQFSPTPTSPTPAFLRQR